MTKAPIDELDARLLLARAEANRCMVRSAETENFVMVAHFVDLHCPESRLRGGSALPGMEKTLRFGGVGNPSMWEFAVADLALALGLSLAATQYLIADSLDTRHRLPRLWERVQAGEVRVHVTRHVAQQTRHLSIEAAGFVDAEVAGYADGRKSWADFERLVAGKIVAADPELAAARERDAGERQFARRSRNSDHGISAFIIRAGAALITRFDASVAYLAEALKAFGDADNEEQRRIKACLILANPTHAVELLQAYANHRAKGSSDSSNGAAGDSEDQPLPLRDTDPGSEPEPKSAPDESESGDPTPFTRPQPFRPGAIRPDVGPHTWRLDHTKLLPTVTLYVHVHRGSVQEGEHAVARWEGECPVTVEFVQQYLAPYQRFKVHPVIDLANQAPVDAYEIPDRHRQAVHLMMPADIFPFAAAGDRTKQVDHTQPYVPMDAGGAPGQSGIGNYGPMNTPHHRTKTFGNLEVRQPFPGIFIWRNQYGQHWLVDHTGTRPITGPSAHGGRHRNTSVTIDVYRGDPIECYPVHAA